VKKETCGSLFFSFANPINMGGGLPPSTFDRVDLRMCDNAHHFEPTPESS
jgi:hypothetical protein